MSTSFRIGQIIEGKVTGIQNYGVFVQIGDDTQGLVHISECKHGFIQNLDGFVKIGEKIKVRIIDIDEYTGKISLSIRALHKMNTPPFPARNRKIPKRRLPKIGFKTLDQAMPKKIQIALKDIETDRFNRGRD